MPKPFTHWIWKPYSVMRGVAYVTEMVGISEKQNDDLLHGSRLVKIPRLIIKETTRGRFYDHLGNYTNTLLVSPTIKRVLEQMPGVHLQFIPATVRGQSKLKYFAVNVLDKFAALDLERSRYDTFPDTGGISRIKKFVLRSIPDDAPAIFHVAEDVTKILINDDLRRRLEEASKHPGVLMPAEKYRNEF